jgi:hypothetical protein
MPAAQAAGADPAAAEALFRSAKEAAKSGDWAAACTRFAESQRLDPAPGTLLNLADCEERVGRLASAWQHYVEARDALPSDDPRRAFAAERVQRLEPQVPKLTVRVAGKLPDGARLLRNDIEFGAGALGLPLPVDPGAHVVKVVTADGTSQNDVKLAAGESRELVLPLPTGGPAAVAERVEPTAKPANGRRTLGLALGGVGVVGIAVGTVTGIMTIDRANTYKERCSPDGVCDAEGLEAARSGRTLEVVSPVALGLGVASLAAGTYFFLTADKHENKVVAAPLPGGAGVFWSRRF